MELATIEHNVPSSILLLNEVILARVDDVIRAADLIDTVIDTNAEIANGTILALAGLLKEIEEERRKAKAPVLYLGREIEAAANEALQPLKAAKDRLAQKMASFQRAAAAERERIERENAARIAKAQREAEAERRKEDARRRKEEEERKAREKVDKPKLVDRIMSKAAPPPEPPKPAAPIPVELETVPEVIKSAVTTRKKPTPHVHDRTLIPWEIAGEILLKVDMASVRRLHKRGIDVPGIAWIDEENLSTRAG